MYRRIFLLATMLVGYSIVAVANQGATVILKSSERVSGQLSYGGGGDLDVQGRKVPLTDIAIVAFAAGDPTAAELRQVPRDDNAPEFQRHAVALRDGSVVLGKFYKFSPTGDTVTLDQGSGQRRDFSANDVARLYLAGAEARSVYASVLRAARGSTAVATSGVSPVPGNGLIVNGNQPWTDTSIDVRGGESVTFHASGQIHIALGEDPAVLASPDGSSLFPAPRTSYPVPGMPVGALIGKVGANGRPFLIGSNMQPMRMPGSGRLFIGINDDGFGDNSGAFNVVIQR